MRSAIELAIDLSVKRHARRQTGVANGQRRA